MKLCIFKEDIHDDKELIWEKHKAYEITFENEDSYYFGEPIKNGIDKSLKGKMLYGS